MYGWDGELDNIVDELFNKRKYITIIPKWSLPKRMFSMIIKIVVFKRNVWDTL
jgi:hypothetical protein